MGFYDFSKEERNKLVEKINQSILSNLQQNKNNYILQYFADEDTYIRKTAYISIGKIYKLNKNLQSSILKLLDQLFTLKEEKIRQTTINSAGEIGIIHFKVIEHLMQKGLFDEHHTVRNAVIGSIKKMGEKNPKPVLIFAKKFLQHPDKEIRREICHGIELRGRTHPQDILPLLKELQFDKTARVRNTLIHVIGQISYKKGCLEIVTKHLKTWKNKELVKHTLEEIIDVHERYKKFAAKTQIEAKQYLKKHF